MAKPLNADRYLTRRWAYGTAAIVYYVRPGGNDNNNGLTDTTAFATLERALHFMAIAQVNQPVIVDVTGMTISGTSLLNLGGTSLGGISFAFDAAATSPNNFVSRRHRQIRSELVLTQALTVTNQTFNATSGLLTLTVSNSLTANALRGKFAVGSVVGEWGTIRSHTSGAGPNTIVVANTVGLTAPIGAYSPGASLTFGDPASQDQAIYVTALADWGFQGLTIAANSKASAVSVWPVTPVDFVLCDIAGLDLQEGGGVVTIDGCYIHGGTFAQNGATVRATQSVFRSLQFLCHGSGASGLNEWSGVALDANLSAFGGGNDESRYTFQLDNFEIDSAVGDGISSRFGASTMSSGIISNCGGNAVVAVGPQLLGMGTITGTGNVGFGLSATYGAIVQPSGVTVTGTAGNLTVGAVGTTTWGSTPITDTDQLVRVG